jgi:hypothetical protein
MIITDINNKDITVTDLKGAIAQAKMYSTFDPSHIENTAYWTDMYKKLVNLGLGEILTRHDELEASDPKYGDYPEFVQVMQMVFKDHNRTTKGYSKDSKTSPLYGAHSCVRTDANLRKLDQLEIGETWERFGQPNITRIF